MSDINKTKKPSASLLVAAMEDLLDEGIFVMSGKRRKYCIKEVNFESAEGTEVCVRFRMEDSNRDCFWNFNVKYLNLVLDRLGAVDGDFQFMEEKIHEN